MVKVGRLYVVHGYVLTRLAILVLVGHIRNQNNYIQRQCFVGINPLYPIDNRNVEEAKHNGKKIGDHKYSAAFYLLGRYYLWGTVRPFNCHIFRFLPDA